ncbi:MAG: hypothetical protein ACLP07_03120 [Terracidiphilus sp.]
MKSEKAENRYNALIANIFKNHYKQGVKQFEFRRDELETVAKKLGIKLPKNIGDAIYSLRYRSDLPESISSTCPEGFSWIIAPAGRSIYRFELVRGGGRILPRMDAVAIKIPDATPEIIVAYAQSDEQALLAKVRYNRLVDIFLGITAYSLQNHLRTSVEGIGQIETDELYVGVNREGQQFVIPVQAKGGSDQLSIIQTRQDVACCREKFPSLTCRPVSTQFMADDVIVMFELVAKKDDIKVAEERHYKLVPKDSITPEDLESYRVR